MESIFSWYVESLRLQIITYWLRARNPIDADHYKTVQDTRWNSLQWNYSTDAEKSTGGGENNLTNDVKYVRTSKEEIDEWCPKRTSHWQQEGKYK